MFISIEEALKRYGNGEMLVLVDDENRENEGDLVIAAQFADADAINFMATHGRGLVCTPITEERAAQLQLSPMCPENTALHGTHFTVSVDARDGITTGISAPDRAETIRLIVDEATQADQLARPGHIFPLIALDGGVLRRAGHTEATVDLARLAGLKPAAVLCEILKDDGTMARVPDLIPFAEHHGLAIVNIADLIAYRKRTERLVERAAEADLPTKYGSFRVVSYVCPIENEEHVALVKGDVRGASNVLVRVHSECLTGDVFGSYRCDCGSQLHHAMRAIEDAGCGVVVYMRQEGRGIGLRNKVCAYQLQDQGLDTVEANEQLGFDADLRDYGIGAQILCDLGLTTIRLLTNNPKKIVGLAGYSLEVVEQVPIEIPANEHNRHYLTTKRDKLGHDLKNLDGSDGTTPSTR